MVTVLSASLPNIFGVLTVPVTLNIFRLSVATRASDLFSAAQGRSPDRARPLTPSRRVAARGAQHGLERVHITMHLCTARFAVRGVQSSKPAKL